MKIIAKSVVAAAIGLAASSALATSVFPASIDDAPALSIDSTTRADRYAAEVAPARERGAEIRWLPAWARSSDRAQMSGNAEIADG